jgi:protein involved in sex pheromone biosynthesis
VIVWGEVGVDGEYATEQVPEANVQDDGEKVPAPLVAHVIIPDGEVPVTVAVHKEEEPRVTEEGEHVAETVTAEAAVLVELEGIVPLGG